MTQCLNLFSFFLSLYFFQDGFDSRKPVNVVLPTAPKASRDYDDFSDKVPKDPPYSAYLSNLPYDVDEDEIAAFFKNMRVRCLSSCEIAIFFLVFYSQMWVFILDSKYENP